MGYLTTKKGVTKLSELDIDADLNMATHDITNFAAMIGHATGSDLTNIHEIWSPSGITLGIVSFGTYLYLGGSGGWVEYVVADKEFRPKDNNQYKLGTSSLKWSDIYGVNAHFDNYNLAAGDIPALAASKITSGAFDLARIPTGIQGKLTAACSYLVTKLSELDIDADLNMATHDITNFAAMIGHATGSDLTNIHEIWSPSGITLGIVSFGTYLYLGGGSNWVELHIANKEFRPRTTNEYKCGTSTLKWLDVYATNAHFDNHNLAAGDIPGLATSKITSGVFDLARIPTGIQGKLTAACSYLYSHPSARQCSTGNWAAGSITGILAVAHGGTGVSGDTYDADKVDGCHAGVQKDNVWKIPTQFFQGTVYFYHSDTTPMVGLTASTNGYQLTTHGVSADPTWAAASDLIFSDKNCPKCGKEFKDGDNLVLHVIEHNEVGDILTIPIHKSCAETSKKNIKIKRKVFENQYILDEKTGEPRIQRVQKTIKKIVTKHKLREGYSINIKTGKYTNNKKIVSKAEAIEEVEEEISEVVYEEKEFVI